METDYTVLDRSVWWPCNEDYDVQSCVFIFLERQLCMKDPWRSFQRCRSFVAQGLPRNGNELVMVNEYDSMIQLDV